MAYIELRPGIEYDPDRAMIRKGGKEEDAGFSGLVFSQELEAMERGITPMTKQTSLQAPSTTPWSPNTAPLDSRDWTGTGMGQVLASGAPDIQCSAAPVQNQWGFDGPAAHNPYFTTPSNPLREGLVQGFDKWYTETRVFSTADPAHGTPINSSYSATSEGAAEALRLVQQLDPGAELTSTLFGSAGGPFYADKPVLEISLSDGRTFNAGVLLNAYYNGGRGVTSASDDYLAMVVGSSPIVS